MQGQKSLTTEWQLTAADAGYYAAVLITQEGDVFTAGTSSISGNDQNVKVLGLNQFGFEDLTKAQNSDWDYNDVCISASWA